jgi:hypothetical protein
MDSVGRGDGAVVPLFVLDDRVVWARHFLAHLVDRDLASNNHRWQWVAGTGTDAAPFYPHLQSDGPIPPLGP